MALAPKPQACPNLDIPTHIIGGKQDRPDFIGAMETFAAHQESRNTPTRLDLVPDMGHRYPDDFNERMLTAIEWIQGNQ